MRRLAAAITMVKDDYAFLRRWVAYYGAAFGKDALYVVSHGANPKVDRIAMGCNIWRIPGDFDAGFDAKRWRMLSDFTGGLRNYYEFVICGDVDEYVVVDPKSGMSLAEFLSKRRRTVNITPIGLEVVHRRSEETEDITRRAILGARSYCRYSTYFCKPCVLGKGAKLSRGGHYADDPNLQVFRNLYLFHMKYADYELHLATRRRRGQQVRDAAVEQDAEDSQISKHWFVDEGGEATEIDWLAARPVSNSFDFSGEIEAMRRTWAPRRNDLWGFEKDVGQRLYRIPTRFEGIV